MESNKNRAPSKRHKGDIGEWIREIVNELDDCFLSWGHCL